MMFSKLVLTEEERAVDTQVGYPLGYAKLCRHAAGQLQGLLTPFTEGPPQRFLPYSPQTEDFAKLKEWDSLFPVVAEADRDPPNARKYAEELWQQLDHLGNAGFDPVKFRVDSYGNVVYWNADPSSPLAWEVDHWFPHSRGGRTVVTNLRIVQWQANQRKKNRLEFLVPWWDLQHGCSINQFLSAFASKNADFRKRSFALFFAGGEDESVAREHVGECRPWPQQFREKKAQAGLAAAAIVTVPKDNEEVFRTCIASKVLVVPDPPALSAVTPSAGTPARRRWSVEEEEALRRAVNRFGPGNWKEIKEYEPALANRSTVQIKDKFRLLRGDWQNPGKENMGAVPTANGRSADHLDRQSAATTALQKELRVKIMREEEKREKEEEVVELEETVLKLRQQNEKERLSALELEAVLAKHKQRVEKQRRWAETQSSYRLCLERMIRDTMHQSISYKEQARLNQAACNALMARLDCQKATCEAAEKDLLQRHSQRGVLETAAGDVLNNHGYDVLQKKSVTQGREIVDVSSCVSLILGLEEEGRVEQEIMIPPGGNLTDSDSEADETADEIYKLRQEQRRTKELVHQQQLQQAACKLLEKSLNEVPVQEEDTKEAVQVSPLKIPVESNTSPSRSSVLQDVIEAVKLVEESRESVRLQKMLDTDMKTQGSEGESEFADDEMSNEPHESQEHWKRDNTDVAKAGVEPTCVAKLAVGKCRLGSITTNVKGNSLGAVLGRCEYMQAPVSELVDDLPVPSMGETNADLKQEVQKNVIMVQTENSKVDTPAENIDSATLYKQEYLDELLQQVRFQIPTMEVAEEPVMEDGLLRKSEEHLDQLLQQVLTTHLDRIRRNEDAQTIPDTDDEKVRQIGKSNLDKWLQVLLFKDVDSGGSSPGQESPLHRALSPALSQMSIAAMRGSMELQASRDQDVTKKAGDQNMEKPKGLWGGLLRKMSARHQSEQSLSTKLDEDSDAEDAEKPPQQQQKKHHGVDMDIKDVLNSMNKISLGTEQPVGITPPEGTHQLSETDQENSNVGPATSMRKYSDDCVVEEPATAVWKAEGRVEDGVPGYLLDQNFSIERRYFPRPLSDVDEISETESLSSNHTADGFSNKDPNKMGLRASIKAASLVWKKAVKKLETRLQEGLIPPPPMIAEGAAV